MTALAGQQIAVIGAGRTGQSASRVLVSLGSAVRVLDRAPGAVPAGMMPAAVELRRDDEKDALGGVDLVVPSPGVPHAHPLLERAVAQQIPVWSEIELAARFLTCPILAITGTNGKSTTTTLLGAMVAASGARVFVGGNLGTPLIEALAAPGAYDVAVVEVSSFQLEWVERFHASVAVFLNLTPDHQDRYAGLAEYGAAKARLLATQTGGDFAVLNRDDPWVWEQRQRTRAAVISFGRDPVEFGTFLDAGEVVVWGAAGQQRYVLGDSPLWGEHNRENIQAAITAATAWGLPIEAIRSGLRTTAALPHRLEFVAERGGVRYYDDSKGTNVGAVEKSVRSFDGGIVLLLGGYDKGGDFAVLQPLLRERVQWTLCFGAAASQIAAQLGAASACRVVPDLASAVRCAAASARPGQTVLLSPGCASFDEFRDYAERGQRFRMLVERL